MDNLFIFRLYFIHLVAVETRSMSENSIALNIIPPSCQYDNRRIVEMAIDEPNVKDGVVKLLAELDK